MIIKNLTSEQQKFVVKEITGENREFDVFVEPNGSTSLDLMVLVNPSKYAGILDIEGYEVDKVQVVPEVKLESTPVVESKEIEKIEEEVVEETTESEEATESFICDICGAEFASARGLATHKHKSHE